MAIDRQLLALAALLLGAAGCTSPQGLLFTRTTEPYNLPYEAAGRGATKSCCVDLTQLKEPVSGVGLSVLWTDRVVANAMKKAGMTELRYADLQTLSVLDGVYERRRLIFYGE